MLGKKIKSHKKPANIKMEQMVTRFIMESGKTLKRFTAETINFTNRLTMKKREPINRLIVMDF
jgi:hypothetical protein